MRSMGHFWSHTKFLAVYVLNFIKLTLSHDTFDILGTLLSHTHIHTHTYNRMHTSVILKKHSCFICPITKYRSLKWHAEKRARSNSAPASLWITALLTWWQNKGIFKMHCKVFLISAKCVCCHPMIPGQETAPLMLILLWERNPRSMRQAGQLV